jgi:acetyl-CoA carboxylase carboxyltransferase component
VTRRAECGSESGYRRHLAERTVTCVLCCDAHALHMAQWRARLAMRRTQRDNPLQYQAALDGIEPAEALTEADRHRLVTQLHAAGWTDLEIAKHARMTLYTTARIRGDLLGLPANQGRAAAGGWRDGPE